MKGQLLVHLAVGGNQVEIRISVVFRDVVIGDPISDPASVGRDLRVADPPHLEHVGEAQRALLRQAG